MYNQAIRSSNARAAPAAKPRTLPSIWILTKVVVTALDLHAKKVRLIQQNAKRLDLDDRVAAQVMDARQVAANFAAESFP